MQRGGQTNPLEHASLHSSLLTRSQHMAQQALILTIYHDTHTSYFPTKTRHQPVILQSKVITNNIQHITTEQYQKMSVHMDGMALESRGRGFCTYTECVYTCTGRIVLVVDLLGAKRPGGVVSLLRYSVGQLYLLWGQSPVLRSRLSWEGLQDGRVHI